MRRLKRQPTENIATSALRQEILSGSLEPGTRLRQEELAGRLGVSRMPVRQALSVLEGEGLVKIDPWRGTIVAPLDHDAIRDMYAFRQIVERYVASTLATREVFDTGAIHDVIVAGREATSKGNLLRLIGLDLQFHLHLYEAVGNRVIVSVMRGHWAHIRRVMAVTLTFTEHRTRVWDEHAAIVEAIAAHDAERAGALAESHIVAASTMVMKSLENRLAGIAAKTSPKRTK
jgi:DNA-binding GntR family transcriptional regulator